MRPHPFVTTAPPHHPSSSPPPLSPPIVTTNSIPSISAVKNRHFRGFEKKHVTDGRMNGQMDGRTDRSHCRDARMHLRKVPTCFMLLVLLLLQPCTGQVFFSLKRSMPGFVNDANGHIKYLDLDVQPNRQSASSTVLCNRIKCSFC